MLDIEPTYLIFSILRFVSSISRLSSMTHMFQISGEEIEFVSVHVTNNVVSIKVTLGKRRTPMRTRVFARK